MINGLPDHIVQVGQWIDQERQGRKGRCCFVTVGATASFRALLSEISTPQFLQTLQENGYSNLRIQTGWDDWEWFCHRVQKLTYPELHGLHITTFPITETIKDEMLRTRGALNGQLAGCVIGHCGMNTINSLGEVCRLMPVAYAL